MFHAKRKLIVTKDDLRQADIIENSLSTLAADIPIVIENRWL